MRTFTPHIERLLLALFIALVLVLGAAGYYFTHSFQTHARQTEEGACLRLNIVRATENISHKTDYLFYQLLIAQIQASHHDPVARQFDASLKALADQKVWIPLSNCHEAVDNPDIYQPPQPVRFAVRFPPAHDLRIPKPTAGKLFN